MTSKANWKIALNWKRNFDLGQKYILVFNNIIINLRIDKWLWSARFFKTRVLAIVAVESGKVRIAGQVVKPARNIAVGDVLQIRRGAFHYTIIVTGLCPQRRPAKEAAKLYEETGESRVQREQLRQKIGLASAVTARPKTKPDKKARRQIRKLRYIREWHDQNILHSR